MPDPLETSPLAAARGKLNAIRYPHGRSVRLSLPRRFVGDMLAASRRVPLVPMQRRMRLAEVVAARNARAEHICWPAVFMKAFALVAAERPELRRSYLNFPRPRLYENPINVAGISLEREYRGEEAVCWAQIPQPELFSLAELDALVRHYKTTRLDRIRGFRRALRISRWPWPVRRLLWWMALNIHGRYRGWMFGTFGLSIVAGYGAAGLFILAPTTTTLNYGLFEPDGSLDVRVTYDHRVLDGAQMARVMVALEEKLLGPIREELLALAAAGNSNGAAPRALQTPEPASVASGNGAG